MSGNLSSSSAPPSASVEDAVDQHEHEIEDHEAYQYWGYLFKSDKTGTDRLKSLLRGLKEQMNIHYDPSDSPDLTPTQLAYFYRELHGNYDQLFLGTPSESIAFIYKSLGCLHSLQPLSHSTAFTDPTVPALKTQGWIMWQTIQLLLGPEEHSSFLIEAVQKWDVRDPVSGEKFPNILPRRCFPMEPDKHMVAWYEGVSERLRREAEDEERQREIDAEQAQVRRLQYRNREDVDDDEESVDSRGPALAYFRNPLYRQEGRPTIVRTNSKQRPQMSPRRSSMKDKAKEGASTVGHVIRNIGSPHLWDGRAGSRRDSSRERRRRSSLPDNRYEPSPGERPPSTSGYSSNMQRRGPSSGQLSRQTTEEQAYNGSGEDGPPRPSSRPRPDYDPTLRHSRSHEPTPSQKEVPDYFHGYDDPDQQPESGNLPSLTPNGVGPSFEPSASPLFMARVAKQPQNMRPPSTDHGRASQPPRRPPSANLQGRPYSQSPAPRERDDRRHPSGSRSRSRRRYSPYGDDRAPTSAPATSGPQHFSQPGFPSLGSIPSDRYSNTPPQSAPPGAPPYPTSSPPWQQGFPPGARDRRSNRMSGSDFSGRDGSGGPGGPPPDNRRGSNGGSRPDMRRSSGGGPPPGKHTRFAPPEKGVDGRRYPDDGAPWR